MITDADYKDNAHFSLFSAGTPDSLAVVRDGTDQSFITVGWDKLKPFWTYSNHEDVDFCAANIVGTHLVLCLTTAGGQGGVVAVRNLPNNQWVLIAQADHILAALPLFELGLLVTLHFVHVPYVGSTHSGHQVCVAPLDGRLEAWEDRSVVAEVRPTTQFTNLPPPDWQPRFLVDSSLTNGSLVGLLYERALGLVHAVDGAQFHGLYRLELAAQPLTTLSKP